MIDTGLEGKVAVVTGANHGIGAATAGALAAQGARVFIAFYRGESSYDAAELDRARAAGEGGQKLYAAMQQQPAESVAARVVADGGLAVCHEADLGDAVAIPLLFDHCESELGPVDVLVNNHTHCVPETFDPAMESGMWSPVRTPTADGIDRHFAVNARACALLMSEYLKRYIARGARWGRIVNISTDAAHCHVANISYAASKHAIESYSRSAAAEMGRYGVTVNIVAPGPIQTGYITPEGEAGLAGSTPLGRVGEPSDIADVVVFLASEQARWVTGQLIYVGGGYRMHQ